MLALPNIQDILRKKQPILYSTERLKKSTKKYLLSLSVAHLTFVTYSFVRNSQTPAIHQRLALAHYFAVTPNTDASPVHTLIMEELRTLQSTQEKHKTSCNSTSSTKCKKTAYASLNTGKQLAIHLTLMTKLQSQSGHSIIDMELISLELQPLTAHPVAKHKKYTS